MQGLDRFLPKPRLLETEGIDLAVPAERAWELVRHVELARSAPIRALVALRTFGEASSLRIDDMVSSPARPGFGILAEEPGKTIAVGAIGKVWKRDIPFVHVEPAAFAAFDEPGWVKVAWALEVEPLDASSSRVTIEVRVDATDETSWRRFRRYFRLIGIGSHFIRRSLVAALAREHGFSTRRDAVREGLGGAGRMIAALATPFWRSQRSHAGLSEDVAARAFPGDAIVGSPRWSWTHGIEIDAPVDLVWPWIAQIGADRAGFYSYEWLENLVGCRLHNADAVHPAWAHHAGDALSVHPKMPPLRVEVVEGHWLLASTNPPPITRDDGKPWVAVSWLFFLEPLGTSRCRLVSRYRCATSDDLATRIGMGETLVEPIGFVMDRKMLAGIKERAERYAKIAAPASGRPEHPHAGHA